MSVECASWIRPLAHNHAGSGFDRDPVRSEARAPIGLSERKDRRSLLVKRDRLLPRSWVLRHALQLKQSTATDCCDSWLLASPRLKTAMCSDALPSRSFIVRPSIGCRRQDWGWRSSRAYGQILLTAFRFGTQFNRMRLLDRTACRTIRDIRAREFERPPTVVAAAGV